MAKLLHSSFAMHSTVLVFLWYYSLHVWGLSWLDLDLLFY